MPLPKPRHKLDSFSVPSCIFCRKSGPDRHKIPLCMTFWCWMTLKLSFQNAQLRNEFSWKLTSKRPQKANFRAIEFQFSAKYVGGDIEISGTQKKRKQLSWLMLGFRWSHHNEKMYKNYLWKQLVGTFYPTHFSDSFLMEGLDACYICHHPRSSFEIVLHSSYTQTRVFPIHSIYLRLSKISIPSELM